MDTVTTSATMTGVASGRLSEHASSPKRGHRACVECRSQCVVCANEWAEIVPFPPEGNKCFPEKGRRARKSHPTGINSAWIG
ncbi:hypothetical protein N7528_010148 [Penicillium herquei]|nr:hypothetical protein N7528_010148 [Penicillium herquei]